MIRQNPSETDGDARERKDAFYKVEDYAKIIINLTQLRSF